MIVFLLNLSCLVYLSFNVGIQLVPVTIVPVTIVPVAIVIGYVLLSYFQRGCMMLSLYACTQCQVFIRKYQRQQTSRFCTVHSA